MRSHWRGTWQHLWSNRERLQAAFAAEHPFIARVEPVFVRESTDAFIDLVARDEQGIVVIPWIEVQSTMLIEPEKDPFLWPRVALENILPEELEGLESMLSPWLRSLVLGRHLWSERRHAFGQDTELAERFEEARARHWLGAARYSEVCVAVAPYWYAARFAQGRRVNIRGEGDAATGAAMLARIADVRADFGGSGVTQAARSWFGVEAFARALHGEADVAVAFGTAPDSARVRLGEPAELPEAPLIEVATPSPATVTVSFDPDDGISIRRFAVDAQPNPVQMRATAVPQTPASVGGSAGRILFLLREDRHRAPDADTDAAATLARWLRSEGLRVEMGVLSSKLDLQAFDLIHLYTLQDPREALAWLAAARLAGKPFVLTPHLTDRVPFADWGLETASAAIANTADDAELTERLGFFARRKLLAEKCPRPGAPPHPEYASDLRRLLLEADAIVVSTIEEWRLVQRLSGAEPRLALAASAVDSAAAEESVEHLVGPDPFVFCDAPIEPRSHQLFLAMAAKQLGVPLVLLGPVNEVRYYWLIREVADEQLIFLPKVTPGQRASLYRRAQVFVDLAWIPFGPARLARAILAGASPLVAQGNHSGEPFDQGVRRVDPADLGAILTELRAAWDTPPEALRAGVGRVAAWANPLLARTTIAQVYAAVAARQASVTT